MGQIINTYKCNFRCDHCMFSCGPHKKDMISNHIVDRFIEKYNYGFINYCGGETFLHPDAVFQLENISYRVDTLRIVTNGSLMLTSKGNRRKWWDEFINRNLYNISGNCDFIICLSKDIYHDEEWFNRSNNWKDIHYELIDLSYEFRFTYEEDNRENISRQIYPLGRAVTTGCYDHDGRCMCDFEEFNEDKSYLFSDLTVDPKGNLFLCCNAIGYLGTVFDSEDTIYDNYHKLIKKKGIPKSCLNCNIK